MSGEKLLEKIMKAKAPNIEGRAWLISEEGLKIGMVIKGIEGTEDEMYRYEKTGRDDYILAIRKKEE